MTYLKMLISLLIMHSGAKNKPTLNRRAQFLKEEAAWEGYLCTLYYCIIKKGEEINSTSQIRNTYMQGNQAF